MMIVEVKNPSVVRNGSSDKHLSDSFDGGLMVQRPRDESDERFDDPVSRDGLTWRTVFG